MSSEEATAGQTYPASAGSGLPEYPSGQALDAAEAIWKRMVGTKPFPPLDTIPIAAIIDFHMRPHVERIGVIVDEEYERRLAQEGLKPHVPCTPNPVVRGATESRTSPPRCSTTKSGA